MKTVPEEHQIALAEAAQDRELPNAVRKLAQARLAAFEKLTEVIGTAEAAGLLDRRRTSFDAHAAVRDGEAMAYLRRYQANPIDGPDLAKLLAHIDRATVDIVARRETLEAVLKSRGGRGKNS